MLRATFAVTEILSLLSEFELSWSFLVSNNFGGSIVWKGNASVFSSLFSDTVYSAFVLSVLLIDKESVAAGSFSLDLLGTLNAEVASLCVCDFAAFP